MFWLVCPIHTSLEFSRHESSKSRFRRQQRFRVDGSCSLRRTKQQHVQAAKLHLAGHLAGSGRLEPRRKDAHSRRKLATAYGAYGGRIYTMGMEVDASARHEVLLEDWIQRKVRSGPRGDLCSSSRSNVNLINCLGWWHYIGAYGRRHRPMVMRTELISGRISIYSIIYGALETNCLTTWSPDSTNYFCTSYGSSFWLDILYLMYFR
jgi:hypothetical protein